MKTKEMAMKELESIKDRLFFLNMKDHWTDSDYVTYAELNRKLNELKKALDNQTKP